LGAVEKATSEAAKHGERSSEQLAALVAEARVMMEQAKTEQAERARVAAEKASAASAAKAVAAAKAEAKRLEMEEEMAAITLRMQSDALRLQQMQAELGVSPAAPAPHLDAEETMCVVCFDAPKQYAMLPCLHMCACEACAQQLLHVGRCPVCREPIERVGQVFT
jgi:hypothetical protein